MFPEWDPSANLPLHDVFLDRGLKVNNNKTLTDERLKELLAEIVAEYFQDTIEKMEKANSKPNKITDRQFPKN